MKTSFTTDTWAKGLKIVAILALLGALVYMWLPKPEPTVNAAGRRRSEEQIDAQIEEGRSTLEKVGAKLNQKVFAIPSDQVGPKALAAVGSAANRCGLNLVSFRPQKPQDVEGLVQLGFTATVEGPYLDVARLVRILEAQESRLAVTSVQLNLQDTGDGSVVAAVGVVAFSLVMDAETDTKNRTAGRKANARL